jgi:hypothetical protein
MLPLLDEGLRVVDGCTWCRCLTVVGPLDVAVLVDQQDERRVGDTVGREYVEIWTSSPARSGVSGHRKYQLPASRSTPISRP